MIEKIDNKIYVILPSGKRLHIAIYNKEKKCLEVVRKRDKHLLRKANAYGFNYEVLKQAKNAIWILLHDDYGTYKIPIKSILDNKEFLWFKTQGYEKQIFFTIEQCFTYKLVSDGSNF